MKIIPERASHWYYPDSRPCHQVQAKSGKGLRDATLRDARELGLLPSVTSILKVINKPELENWKQEQAILSALTLPRLENEPIEVFARRIVEDSQAQASEAADFGRKIHKAIEAWLLKVPAPVDPEVEPYLKHLKDWAAENVEEVYRAEAVVVDPNLGYAGTLDLHCRLKGIGDSVLDFKTQGVKDGKPTWYKDWGLQLVAYKKALGVECVLVSIVIDSKEPGPIWCNQWDEHDKLWDVFQSAMKIWCWQKNYYPKNV